ncbi:MAG: hypothetical protein JWM19_1792 [Actinomycetia bacterium]|nr:hypothetical protein [Actinomycetes bacterium]
MARAVELAAVVGTGKVDAALGLAAIAGRFADGDPSITDHLAAEREIGGHQPGEHQATQPDFTMTVDNRSCFCFSGCPGSG